MFYGASKGAINGLVMPMARDLGKFKIRVAAVAPGVFETPMGKHMPKGSDLKFKKDTPLSRLGHPDEFAHFA